MNHIYKFIALSKRIFYMSLNSENYLAGAFSVYKDKMGFQQE